MSHPSAQWMELCVGLGGDHGLIEEVLCALEDPALYAATYAETVGRYRTVELLGDLAEVKWPWLALLAGLYERGLLWDFHHDDEGMEVSYPLEGMRQVEGLELNLDWIKHAEDLEEEQWEQQEYGPPEPRPDPVRRRREWFYHYMYDASRQLARHGLGLLVIELEPWVLPTTIVPLDQRMRIGRLIGELGGVAHLIDVFGTIRILPSGVLVRPDGSVVRAEDSVEA